MTSILEPFASKRVPNETGTISVYANVNNTGGQTEVTSEGIVSSDGSVSLSFQNDASGYTLSLRKNTDNPTNLLTINESGDLSIYGSVIFENTNTKITSIKETIKSSDANNDTSVATVNSIVNYINSKDYINTSQAGSLFLTQAEAEIDYLTKSNAQSTYATKNSLNDYLTKTDASSKYATQTSLNNYVLKTELPKTYYYSTILKPKSTNLQIMNIVDTKNTSDYIAFLYDVPREEHTIPANKTVRFLINAYITINNKASDYPEFPYDSNLFLLSSEKNLITPNDYFKTDNLIKTNYIGKLNLINTSVDEEQNTISTYKTTICFDDSINKFLTGGNFSIFFFLTRGQRNSDTTPQYSKNFILKELNNFLELTILTIDNN